jgi:hypothetical protein
MIALCTSFIVNAVFVILVQGLLMDTGDGVATKSFDDYGLEYNKLRDVTASIVLDYYEDGVIDRFSKMELALSGDSVEISRISWILPDRTSTLFIFENKRDDDDLVGYVIDNSSRRLLARVVNFPP